MSRLAGSVILALALILCGCSDKKPAGAPTGGGPEETGAGLFALARQREPERETLERLFEDLRDEQRLAALYDALSALRDATDPVPLRVEHLDGLGRAVVDFSADLPGGGAAEFSVQLEQAGEGRWKITWFQGPGVEWPPRPGPRGAGLSTSPVPQEQR